MKRLNRSWLAVDLWDVNVLGHRPPTGPARRLAGHVSGDPAGDLHLRDRAGAGVVLGSAALSLLFILFGSTARHDVLSFVAVLALAYFVVTVGSAMQRRHPRLAATTAACAALAIVWIARYDAGQSGRVLVVLYGPILLGAVYFAPRAVAGWQVVAVAVVEAIFATSSAAPSPWLAWIAISGTSAVVVLVATALRERIQALLAELDHAATTDALTGLQNRRAIDVELALRLESAQRVSVILGDLNGFKGLNDRDGHQAGDAALVRVGQLFDAIAPEGAVVGRLGGDEFVVLVNGYSQGELAALATSLVDGTANEFDGKGLTLSVGIAMAPADGTTPDALLRAADRGLYAAKARHYGAAGAERRAGDDRQSPSVTVGRCHTSGSLY